MKSEGQRQTLYDITHMWNLKCDTNEAICETETEAQTQRTDWWWPREGYEGWIGRLGLADVSFFIYRMDKQGPAA